MKLAIVKISYTEESDLLTTTNIFFTSKRPAPSPMSFSEISSVLEWNELKFQFRG